MGFCIIIEMGFRSGCWFLIELDGSSIDFISWGIGLGNYWLWFGLSGVRRSLGAL